MGTSIAPPTEAPDASFESPAGGPSRAAKNIRPLRLVAIGVALVDQIGDRWLQATDLVVELLPPGTAQFCIDGVSMFVSLARQ